MVTAQPIAATSAALLHGSFDVPASQSLSFPGATTFAPLPLSGRGMDFCAGDTLTQNQRPDDARPLP